MPILFTDWDGTVTLQDSNDLLTDTLGMGRPARLALNEAIFHGTTSFRDAFSEMLSSVSDAGHTLEDCIDFLRSNVQLDPGFRTACEWCYDNGVPVVVVSSGMDVVIGALLDTLLKDKQQLRHHIKVYANHVDYNKDGMGSWRIKYRDDTPFGHDKHRSIVAETSLHQKDGDGDGIDNRLYYCGDGVSDISAARSCHVLFAKRGCDLERVCDRDGIACTPFDTFADVLAVMQRETGEE